MLEDLYQEEIIESSKCSANRGELKDSPTALSEAVHNQLCGDSVTLWLDFECDPQTKESVVSKACFSGQGCTISQASASMLVDLIRGKSRAQLEQLIEDFQELLSGSETPEARARLGGAVALEGVKSFPVRMRCALIAYESLRRLLDRIC